ncbi:MAG TPA: polysaccharide deacetylase family protein, partial [Polyangiaceae bacterium]|nr:polysaccharide deacetylase family protein [Polyangiaceae bacterium]
MYVACADPPKNNFPSTGGTGNTEPGEGGAAGSDGQGATSGGGTKGGGGSGGGVSGSSTDLGGEGGTQAGGSGDGGAPGPTGDGGMNAAGEAGAGTGPISSCGDVAVGVASGLPVRDTPDDVQKPDGTFGGLEVLHWAGYDGAITYTLDDALQSQITNYDTLNGLGVPFTFFLVAGNDGNKAIWKQMAKDGHELGNHTMHHCSANGTGCGWGTWTNIDDELDLCT